MRKVDLRLNEQQKYEVIKKLVETSGNKNTAAIKLGCTRRHINRLVQGYLKHGKAYFYHGNRNRAPVNALPVKLKNLITDLYKNKYYDSNFAHFAELLGRFENIHISRSAVRSILMEKQILSPKANRVTKKKLKKQLQEKSLKASSKKEQNCIQQQLVLLEDTHPRRPRCAHFGELIQMDASDHLWFGNKNTFLHVAVDDSTGTIVGARFGQQETLKGYYNVFSQILKSYGIPYRFYTDRRSVFEYTRKNISCIEKDLFTQFGYACRQLGVDIKTTSIPQAKGRVERLFQTLQSRLPIELRLKGATTIEQANEFLNHYIKEFNDTFALPIDYTTSVFESSPSDEKINLILAVLAQRKIDSGHCIRFENAFYKPVDKLGNAIYYRKGTGCMVIKAYDGNLFTSIGEQVYALDPVPQREKSSRDFAVDKVQDRPRKRYVPPMTHPWKAKTFTDYVNTQSHYFENLLPPFEDVIHSQEIFY